MIRIICLNPVIDRVYYISDFVEAKKYYEIRPQIFVGGKGINIARVMSQMGEKCSLNEGISYRWRNKNDH